VVRIATDPNNERSEFAIIVRSDQKGQGLGTALLDKIIRYCKSRGTEMIVGQVLRENRAMLTMAEHFGFHARTPPGGDSVEVELELNKKAA
jgi:acetyltransferase